MTGVDVVLEPGAVDPELRSEFPGLALHTAVVPVRHGPSPMAVRLQLRALADRVTGAKAVELRRSAVPWAYRVFWRQVGVDPDEHRTPPEAIVLERMFSGGFPSRGLIADARTIAIAETGIALFVLDHARVRGRLGIRLARRGERYADDPTPVGRGRIVLADEERVLAPLVGGPGVATAPGTTEAVVAALEVRGVPRLAIEEAVWLFAAIAGSEPEAGPPEEGAEAPERGA